MFMNDRWAMFMNDRWAMFINHPDTDNLMRKLDSPDNDIHKVKNTTVFGVAGDQRAWLTRRSLQSLPRL
jgi:hypothetical protein